MLRMVRLFTRPHRHSNKCRTVAGNAMHIFPSTLTMQSELRNNALVFVYNGMKDIALSAVGAVTVTLKKNNFEQELYC